MKRNSGGKNNESYWKKNLGPEQYEQDGIFAHV